MTKPVIVTKTKRTYGFNAIGGLVEKPGVGYEPVRLGLDAGDLVAVDEDGEIVMRATGRRDGWYFRRYRLAARWQRVGGALLAKEA